MNNAAPVLCCYALSRQSTAAMAGMTAACYAKKPMPVSDGRTDDKDGKRSEVKDRPFWVQCMHRTDSCAQGHIDPQRSIQVECLLVPVPALQ